MKWFLRYFYRCSLMIICLLFLGTTAYAGAERVKRIHPNGVLEFETGRQVKLAGIDVPIETIRTFPALLASKDIDVQILESPKKVGEVTPRAAYLFLTLDEIPLPYQQGKAAKAKKVMLNEMLVQTGAARVRREIDFRHRQKFIDLEDVAKKKGYGIWSYEKWHEN